MPRSYISRAAAIATLALCAGAAQASTVTFNNWTFGNGNAVKVNNPSYSGAAGGFTATLSGFGNWDGVVSTYCVDLYEFFSFGTGYTDYSLVTAGSQFSAAKVQALGRLISYVASSNLFNSTAAAYKDDQSTALQLAIWNIVYDTDNTLDAGGSALFSDASAFKNGSANFMGANPLLAASQLATQTIGYELFVLKSVGTPGHQDQLVWRTQGVPEPASLALVALALGAAGIAARRRA
jgi:hypothetical protein